MDTGHSKEILYSKETDSFMLSEGSDINTIQTTAPLSVGWVITGRCNLKCIHCYGNQEELPKNEITTEEAFIIASRIVKEGVKRVSISGGEPMLRKDLFQIVDYLSDNGVWVIVSSNGIGVKENIESLKKLRHLEISLDWSTAKIHDFIRPSRSKENPLSFSIALEALRALVNAGIKTRVLTTINMYNQHEMSGIGQILTELWVEEWHIGRTVNAWRARFIYDRLNVGFDFNDADLEKLKQEFPTLKIQFNYPAGKISRYYALILPDGQMNTQDTISWEKIVLGSLVLNTFSYFWNDANFDMYGHYRKWLNIKT